MAQVDRQEKQAIPPCNAAVVPRRVLQLRNQRVTTQELRAMLADSPRNAAGWAEAAAKAGLVPAQIVWGQLLLDGHGVARNAQAAFGWFERAAARGDADACNMVGRCYEQGWGVVVDFERATQSFEIAASTGHAWAQVNLAQMLMRTGDIADRPRCFSLFNAAARSGTSKVNMKAMNSLARFLEEGWAGQPDRAGATYWYLKAAKLGDHWAQYNLATILFQQGDAAAAGKLIRSAIAASDNGFRRRIAAQLLERSDPSLRRLGLDALALCAAGNHASDLYAYGLALDLGAAGSRDPRRAKRLFRAAAAKGHVAASLRFKGVARLSSFYVHALQKIRSAVVLLSASVSTFTIHSERLS